MFMGFSMNVQEFLNSFTSQFFSVLYVYWPSICSLPLLRWPGYSALFGVHLPDEGELVLVFSESPLARHIFGKMDVIQCMYTVQIIPRTDKDSVEVVLFTKEDELKFFSYFRKTGKIIKPGDLPRKKFSFRGVEQDETYTIKVSLGKAAQATLIAASMMNVKEV
ncbi:uncharacterized protein LOC111696180 [Eurytemora carolleeae]|uniref:uncharacterized protein LOC111696180 n=1 Tax=Eurytemora carolleeae TaxID=1294199 RepID=UPI000C790314|nr:uncharacterized protein LOC111696180 [Eurytemora carolleeae]|eukprot:XP_023321498.1 uncharacterized protein LOC111696180 [Eurytemora affinis]